ncbi:hypothetical protein [Gordonia sp. NPDC058843]
MRFSAERLVMLVPIPCDARVDCRTEFVTGQIAQILGTLPVSAS